MTETLILAFCAFLIALLGTKWVIVSLKKRPTPPDIEVLMGRREPPPLPEAGLALSFALVICLLGTDVSFLIVLSMFLLAGMPMLGRCVEVPKMIKLATVVLAVGVGLSAFSGLALSEKMLAGALWGLVILVFYAARNKNGLIPVFMFVVGFAIACSEALAEHFPSLLATRSLIFVAAALGFWWWNHGKAKVLAGEIGALPAGFIAGYLLLMVWLLG